MRETRSTPNHLHQPTQPGPSKVKRHLGIIIVSLVCIAALIAACLVFKPWKYWFEGESNTSSQTQQKTTEDMNKEADPKPDTSPATMAKRMVDAMSMDERVGQLIMAPLYAGTDASTLQSLISDQHVGSVLIIGNWNNGTASVKQATDQLQSYAASNNKLLVTTDQEGGLVQHLKGSGFDTMPSATEQGQMSTDDLRSSATTWGKQLAAAGINVDLAPVLGTVTVDRASNAPIGALNRDFGLDANGNAEHGIAFINGMRDSGIQTSIKHYPGLGSVTGNTDFTADGTIDTTTTLTSDEISAFDKAIKEGKPAMVMMALATYQAIDGNNPAAFSSTIIDHIRNDEGYDGVITSDSLSAAAVSAYATDQLGVKLVDAGGDLACIGELDYVQAIIDGLKAKAASDSAFAEKVTKSATRIMKLKLEMGLATAE